MFDFTITPDGKEPYYLTATSRDVLMWEKAGKNRSFTALLTNRNFTDLYSLAHIASRRQGMFVGTLDEFEEQCDLKGGRDDKKEEGEPDPTQSAPSAEG
jgi:hypothetical protein